MKTFITTASLLAIMIFASACNTVKGIGKDVERGGEKVQDAATGAQNPPQKTY
jgi:entericidin B